MKSNLEKIKGQCKANAKALGVPLTSYYAALANKVGFGSWDRLSKQIDAGNFEPDDLRWPDRTDFARRTRTATEVVKSFKATYVPAAHTDHRKHGLSATVILESMSPAVRAIAGLRATFEALDANVSGGWIHKNYAEAYSQFVENHTRAAEISPYVTAEGGYLYPTVTVDDVLCDFFDEMDCPSVQELIMRLDEVGPWCKDDVDDQETDPDVGGRSHTEPSHGLMQGTGWGLTPQLRAKIEALIAIDNNHRNEQDKKSSRGISSNLGDPDAIDEILSGGPSPVFQALAELSKDDLSYIMALMWWGRGDGVAEFGATFDAVLNYAKNRCNDDSIYYIGEKPLGIYLPRGLDRLGIA